MKRAVITGPTGAIGTALIAELISHGIEVEAVVRPDSRRTDNIPKSPLVHIVPCDLKELKTDRTRRRILPLWLGRDVWQQP